MTGFQSHNNSVRTASRKKDAVWRHVFLKFVNCRELIRKF